MQLRRVQELNVKHRRVLVRVDYNVPLDQDGNITDDFRIRASLTTLNHLLEQGAALVLTSHLGRPKGQFRKELSLKPVAVRLAELLERPVKMAPDCIGAETEALANQLKPGEVLLLENLRFHAGETANDPTFAESLARLAEVYVNDAFGTAHRAHASNVGAALHFSERAAGFLIQREVEYLVEKVERPERPFVVILGGAKVSGKLELIQRLAQRADRVLIGGGMAFTFLTAPPLNYEVGNSLVEQDKIELAAQLMETYGGEQGKLVLPVDCLAAEDLDAEQAEVVTCSDFPTGKMGLDIGPKTVTRFKEILQTARTVLWNGPVGVFEKEPFAVGSREIAHTLVELTAAGALTLVGGGDTAAALKHFGLSEKVSFVSTGGGASLELLSGKSLPALEVLQKE